MDTPNSFGISIFNRNTRLSRCRSAIEERGKGGTIAYGYRLRRFDSLSLVYGLERVEDALRESTSLPDENGNVPISDISDFDFTISSIGPSYSLRLARQPVRHDARRPRQHRR